MLAASASIVVGRCHFLLFGLLRASEYILYAFAVYIMYVLYAYVQPYT